MFDAKKTYFTVQLVILLNFIQVKIDYFLISSYMFSSNEVI